MVYELSRMVSPKKFHIWLQDFCWLSDDRLQLWFSHLKIKSQIRYMTLDTIKMSSFFLELLEISKRFDVPMGIDENTKFGFTDFHLYNKDEMENKECKILKIKDLIFMGIKNARNASCTAIFGDRFQEVVNVCKMHDPGMFYKFTERNFSELDDRRIYHYKRKIVDLSSRRLFHKAKEEYIKCMEEFSSKGKRIINYETRQSINNKINKIPYNVKEVVHKAVMQYNEIKTMNDLTKNYEDEMFKMLDGIVDSKILEIEQKNGTDIVTFWKETGYHRDRKSVV